MKPHFLLFIGLGFFLAPASRADEQTRDIQSKLKDAGFYYGAVTGEKNTETGAAIRRYQIRNGLQVTGALNQETLDSLSKSEGVSQESPAPEQAPQRPAPQAAIEPERPSNVQPRTFPDEQPFLRKPQESIPQSGIDEPLIPYSQVFVRSPYERAPMPVQQETVKRVQSKLAGKGFYRGPADGQPTEVLRRAIASYQDARGLRPSGFLDVDTLHEMQLLPGESSSPFGTGQSRPKQKIYRGIEVR